MQTALGMKTGTKHESLPSGTPQPTARMHIIMAREAPVGIIFRRGPSRWVHLAKWNTATDTFEHGQWFHGRIYPRRSDLSPNGQLLVYFCTKWSERRIEEAKQMLDKEKAGDITYELRLLLKRRPKVRSEYTYAWTAVSKPPYLTALGLWPKGDCWHGGGLFKSNRDLWLNHKPLVAIPHKDHLPIALRVENNPAASLGTGENDPIYSMRLERDGWKKVQDFVGSSFKTQQPEIRIKASNKNPEIKLLVERSMTECTYQESFSVLDGSDKVELQGAEWADWDHAGRLVFAAGGSLFASELSSFPQLLATQLADLNALKPELCAPPDWAKCW